MNKIHFYTRQLHNEVIPAVGCTEPIAIAFAAASARKKLEEKLKISPSGSSKNSSSVKSRCEYLESIHLKLSENIIKNAMGVGVPGTGMVGIPIAAAMGFCGGDAEKGLEVLGTVTTDDIQQAKTIVQREIITTSMYEGPEKLYVEVEISWKGHRGRVVIAHEHTHVVSISIDDDTIFQAEEPNSQQNPRKKQSSSPEMKEASEKTDQESSVRSIYEFVSHADPEEIRFVLRGAEMNRAIAEEGLSGDYGMRVGKVVREQAAQGILSANMMTSAVELAAGAVDARMSGCMMPVMTNSGSGNQGITATLPVVAAAEYLGSDENQLIRALALSHLLAIHMKRDMGRLSALCGAVTAGAAAGCGAAFLMGGELEAITGTIQNVIGDAAGIICDGAKAGCAMKIASMVEAGVRAAVLAVNGSVITADEGIIEEDVEESIRNLARIGSVGMEKTDKEILAIMVTQ
ncbi:MAG: L-serine ammonia-lyase, iron-sulfur-dependent, subunit alpha [Spirochaetales bacterium]|nr:L-serine ammonia-lyase, iron-sulfur-dependent, subunit alpha [Spirochaetales bacterium]